MSATLSLLEIRSNIKFLKYFIFIIFLSFCFVLVSVDVKTKNDYYSNRSVALFMWKNTADIFPFSPLCGGENQYLWHVTLMWCVVISQCFLIISRLKWKSRIPFVWYLFIKNLVIKITLKLSNCRECILDDFQTGSILSSTLLERFCMYTVCYFFYTNSLFSMLFSL